MSERILATEQETEAFARDCADLRKNASGATLIALSGELGAGKTTFAKGFARALGVTESVQSPTFVLAKYYDLPAGPFRRLVHMDAYRLNGPHELAALGWDDLLSDKAAIILLEWPERVAPLPASPDLSLDFSVIPSGGRKVSLRRSA